jgi:hypothetical protein
VFSLLLIGACGSAAPSGPDGAPAAVDAPASPVDGAVDAPAPDAQLPGAPYFGADGNYLEAWQIDPIGQTFAVTFTSRPGASAPEIQASGTITPLASGLARLVVTAVSDFAFPLDGSASYLAAGVPGTGYVVSPSLRIGGAPHPLVLAGDCAAQQATFGYLVLAPGSNNFLPVTSAAYGSIAFSGPPTAVALAGTKRSLDCVLAGGVCTVSAALDPPAPGPCVAGQTSFAGGAVAQAGAGALVASVDPTTQLIGFAEDPAIAIGDITGHNYVGFAVTPEFDIAAALDFGTTNNATGRFIIDPVTGQTATDKDIAFQFDGTITSGRIRGTATGAQQVAAPVTGVARRVGTHVLLDLISASPTDGTPVYLLMVSR